MKQVLYYENGEPVCMPAGSPIYWAGDDGVLHRVPDHVTRAGPRHDDISPRKVAVVVVLIVAAVGALFWRLYSGLPS